VGNEMLPTDLSKQLFPLVSDVLQKFELVLNNHLNDCFELS